MTSIKIKIKIRLYALLITLLCLPIQPAYANLNSLGIFTTTVVTTSWLGFQNARNQIRGAYHQNGLLTSARAIGGGVLQGSRRLFTDSARYLARSPMGMFTFAAATLAGSHYYTTGDDDSRALTQELTEVILRSAIATQGYAFVSAGAMIIVPASALPLATIGVNFAIVTGAKVAAAQVINLLEIARGDTSQAETRTMHAFVCGCGTTISDVLFGAGPMISAVRAGTSGGIVHLTGAAAAPHAVSIRHLSRELTAYENAGATAVSRVAYGLNAALWSSASSYFILGNEPETVRQGAATALFRGWSFAIPHYASTVHGLNYLHTERVAICLSGVAVYCQANSALITNIIEASTDDASEYESNLERYFINDNY